jgi:lipopolysaccharide transport system permease protein
MIEIGDSPVAPPLEQALHSPPVGAPLREDDADWPETVIRPRTGWIAVDWREMWSHRELLLFLIWRDVAVRYKQTVLGVAWAVVQPLVMMTIFTLIFGRFARVKPPGGMPYPVFVFAGLIPWTLFSQGMAAAALSLVNQQQLLTKVYFPRLFIPTAAASVFVVDVLISLAIYGGILLYYGIAPSWGIVGLPLLILLTLVATLGVGVALAALTVFYRDFKHIVPFLVQILMFLTPAIFYPMQEIGPRWRLILSLNPVFGIIGAFRTSILGGEWYLGSLAISTASALAMFAFSLYYFRKTERWFADFA